MTNLFNFQPLFFFNIEKLIGDRQHLQIADPEAVQYAQGTGFDHLNGRRPDFLPVYFGDQQANKMLQLPYRLPGVESPLSVLLQQQQRPFMSQRVKQVYEPLNSLFMSMQPNDVQAFLNKPQQSLLSKDTATQLLNMAKQHMIEAAERQSIIASFESQQKMKNTSISNQGKFFGQIGDNRITEPVSEEPLQLQELKSKYKEDLSKIIPFSSVDNAVAVMKTAYGQRNTNQHLYSMYNTVGKKPIQLPNDKKTTLFQTAANTIIKRRDILPVKRQRHTVDEFMQSDFGEERRQLAPYIPPQIMNSVKAKAFSRFVAV